MELKEFEFYGTPSGSVMITGPGKALKVYEVSDREFTAAMIERLGEFYPEALAALGDHYTKSKGNRHYYEYLMVHRFIRCNFNEYDSRADIDVHGAFRFEFVQCPLRGECKHCNIICGPKFNAKLSDREFQVMKLYYESYSTEEIADILYRSICTIKKHKRNSLERLKMHSLTEFITYAAKNKMFENE